jgi:uncharacterized protein (TIGR03437 family)
MSIRMRIAAGMILAASQAFGQGTITTVVGSATCCKSPDGSAATSIWLTSAGGLAMDKQGNLYIYENQMSKVRKVNAAGIISTIAGNGTPGYAGDGGPATSAELFPTGSVMGLAVDSAGNVYISDGYNNAVRKVDTNGNISTVAGNGTAGFSGDGGPATKAQLYFPAGIALDGAGNLYIADTSNNRVRKVSPSGMITTFAGNGNVVYSGDNVQAATTAVNRPEGVTVDAQGNVYIAETSDSRVRKVDTSGNITTVAGQTKKTGGFSGDGGPATAATLSGPRGLAVDAFGNLYIADNGNSRIRKVNAAGIIQTYAGISGGASTPIGDGGPATSAFLGTPADVVVDAGGNLYISASAGGTTRIRKVASGAGAGFLATPASLSFSSVTGGATPAGQSISVTSSGAPLTFTVSVSTNSGGNWLSVNPASGATPATLAVTANPAGLGAGTYSGAITLMPAGSGNSPLSYNVTLAVTGAGAPSFTSAGIVNALGYQNILAPDTIFTIFGTNLGPAQFVGATGSFSTSLAGTSINFTPAAGGAAIDAKIVYTASSQVAGLLPSSITPGTYAVRVTYNGVTSSPQNVTVASRSFGIATSNSGGTGTAQANIGNLNGGLSLTRFTSGTSASGGYNWVLSPAHPGDILVLWGTGGGADPANDAGGTSGDQTAAGNFVVTVDGRQITPLYAGATSGFPGLWQINFAIPPDIAPDCFALAQVTAGGQTGNSVNIPIAPAGQTACADPSTPASVFSKLDSGGNLILAAFAIAKIATSSITRETASGDVFSYSPAEWITLNSGPQFGACRVYQRTYPVGGRDPATPDAALDAGPKLSFSGPNVPAGSAMVPISSVIGTSYGGALTLGTLTAGTYNLSGPGGSQVAAFSASTVFPGSFTVTNWNSITSIDRTQPLTLSWTGSGVDQVGVVIASVVVAGGQDHLTTINCTVPAAPDSYTIAAGALGLLPAGSVAVSVQGLHANPFTASLASGAPIDLTTFTANLGVAKSVVAQ